MKPASCEQAWPGGIECEVLQLRLSALDGSMLLSPFQKIVFVPKASRALEMSLYSHGASLA